MDKPQVNQRRLSKGSFQRIILTDFWHLAAFEPPELCASCGSHLGPDDVAEEHEFRSSPSEGTALGSAWKGYLCNGCAAHGYPVTDFIRFYRNPKNSDELVIEVGSKPLVAAFKQAATDYINKNSKAFVELANEQIRQRSTGYGVTVLHDEQSYKEAAQDQFFRTDPEKNTKFQEIGSYSKRGGCLTVFLAMAGLSALVAMSFV